jgi:alpha-D-xyloside xylohydrolase
MTDAEFLVDEFYVDSFARDRSRPLTCVTEVTDVEGDANGVTLRCETLRIQRRLQERYGTGLEVGVPLGPGPVATVRLDVIASSVLRVRFAPGHRVPENRTPLLAGELAGRPDFELTTAGSQVRLCTPELEVALAVAPYRMRVLDGHRTTLMSTVGVGAPQQPPTPMAQACEGLDELSNAWPWFLRDLFPLGFIEDPATGTMQTFETSAMHDDEHLYGFGERYGLLDKRGQTIALWQTNAAGTSWPVSYKNVPFFLSTAGYGHFINSSYPITYHMGDRSHAFYSFHVQQGLLDYFLIAGPSFKEILPRYTALTGPPELPPLWSFGLWMSRMTYQTQAEVEGVARRLREERVPCDVINLDNGWCRDSWVNDLVFDPERFPDPAGMIGRLKEQGFRVCLWQIPYISTTSRLFKEGRTAGYFARNADGEPRLIDGFFGPAAVIDFSNPEAVAWYGRALQPLFDMGVAALGADFGEGAPVDARYHAGDGLQVHNLYPLLYNEAIVGYTERATGDRLTWGRSAYAGSQRHPVHWAGDSAARWEDLGLGLYGGLGLGLCGFPFWSQDIGGYIGTPTSRLYIRWAELGLFMTHARAHGTTDREPWAFGEEALQIFRRYAELRYRLLPYLWSEAVRCVRRSQPVMRPMVLDWQDDPATHTLGSQFMLGEHLLFAPVLDETDRRSVYLPEGAWMSFFTGQVLHGPRWVQVDAALDELPIFLRAGAILPLAEPVQHTGELDWERLDIEVFPARRSQFTLVRPDLEEVELACGRSGNRLCLSIEPPHAVHELRLHGVTAARQVTVDGHTVPWRQAATHLSVRPDRALGRLLVVEGAHRVRP